MKLFARLFAHTVRTSIAAGFFFATLVHANDSRTLPDGRVVIDILGTRVAFNPVTNQKPENPIAVFYLSDGKYFGLRKVLNDPQAAEAQFNASDKVIVRMTKIPGKFSKRHDRESIVAYPRTMLTFWRDPIDKICSEELGKRSLPGTAIDCKRFNALAFGNSATDENGLIVVHHPRNPNTPSGSGLPSITTYIFPASKRVSATDEAIFFQCQDNFKSCRTGVSNYVGYAVRPNVALQYEFRLDDYPESSISKLDSLVNDFVDELLLIPDE